MTIAPDKAELEANWRQQPGTYLVAVGFNVTEPQTLRFIPGLSVAYPRASSGR